MSKSYPDMIPEAYASSEALSDAYRRGWNHGHGIACHTVPEMGAKLWLDTLGHVTVDAENIREVHQDLCSMAEANSRQYSPFEFTASEFNAAGDGADASPSSEELWNAFDAGTADAILADLGEYTDEDYGIEGEDED